MHSGLKYEVDKLREAWFNKNSLTKIFSFANLVDKSRIKYDSKIEDSFWVHVVNKKVKFKRIANIIYGMCPGTTDDEQKQLLKMQVINTVDENKTNFELFNLVRCRSVEYLKAAI